MAYKEMLDRQRKEIEAISTSMEPNRLRQMLHRHRAEVDAAIEADATGDGFIHQMFLYELDRHDYRHTGDLDSTLHDTGYSREEVDSDPRLRRGLYTAAAEILTAAE